MSTTKTCTGCGEVKGLEGFHKSRKGLYGRHSQCKSCKNIYRKSHYRKNSERIKEQVAAWNADNPKKWAFLVQRKDAKHRGIQWLFSYEEWVHWWGEDFKRRGKSLTDLQMCRTKDQGPYAPWNVYKATKAKNLKDYHKWKAA